MCTGQSYDLSYQVQAVWALTDRQYKLMLAVTHVRRNGLFADTCGPLASVASYTTLLKPVGHRRCHGTTVLSKLFHICCSKTSSFHSRDAWISAQRDMLMIKTRTWSRDLSIHSDLSSGHLVSLQTTHRHTDRRWHSEEHCTRSRTSNSSNITSRGGSKNLAIYFSSLLLPRHASSVEVEE